MRPTLLLLPLFAACSFPKSVASKTVELEIPLEQATVLSCRNHNGDITVSKGPSDGFVTVRAELRVRGHSQAEADDNLATMSLRHEIDGTELRLIRDYPKQEMSGFSPSYRFTIAVPAHLALDLHSHNGNITTTGTTGHIEVRTHNGDIDAEVANPEVHAGTHNGDIALAIVIPGQLESSVRSHNGNVRVKLHPETSAWIEARSHNGRINPPDGAFDTTTKKRSMRCRVGEQQTEGELKVRTHNGNVRID